MSPSFHELSIWKSKKNIRSNFCCEYKNIFLFYFDDLGSNGSASKTKGFSGFESYICFICKGKCLAYGNCLSRLDLCHKLIDGIVIRFRNSS